MTQQAAVTESQKDGEFQVSDRGRIWLILAIIVGLLGVAVSLYATKHHLAVKASGHTDAVCNINATLSCDAIAQSAYSELFGIPVAVFGLGYFVAMIVLAGIGLYSRKSAREHLHGYVALVGIGVVVSVVLGAISAIKIGAGCPTCMVVYALTFIQAGILFVYRREIPSGLDLKNMFSGATTGAIAVAVVIAGYSFLKPAPSEPAQKTADSAGEEGAPKISEQSFDIPVHKSPYSGLGEDYRRGSDTAKVVVQEFADFECPACRQAMSTVDALHREYGDRILLVFRNYPLDESCNPSIHNKMHEYACQAAVMGRCAGQYGKFWDFYHMAYENQPDLSNAKLREWGRKIGLTDEQINTCWDSKDIMAKIHDDISLADKAGLNATPTFYVNGHKVLAGHGLAELKSQIDQFLE